MVLSALHIVLTCIAITTYLCVQPTMIEVTGAPAPKPPEEQSAEQERAPCEPEWTAEHAVRAADALEGAYSPDYEAEADPPEVRSHDAQGPALRAAPCHAQLFSSECNSASVGNG